VLVACDEGVYREGVLQGRLAGGKRRWLANTAPTQWRHRIRLDGLFIAVGEPATANRYTQPGQQVQAINAQGPTF